MITSAEGFLLAGLFLAGMAIGAATVSRTWDECRLYLAGAGAALMIVVVGIVGVLGERQGCPSHQDRVNGACVTEKE